MVLNVLFYVDPVKTFGLKSNNWLSGPKNKVEVMINTSAS